MKHLRAAWRLTAVALLAITLILPVLAAGKWRPRLRNRLVQIFFKLALRAMGVRWSAKGTPPPAGTPALMVSNHLSYIDIFVLCAATGAIFIAKEDIRGWPVVRHFVNSAGTLYVSRKPQAMKEEAAQLRDTLLSGQRLVLFAEGTTGTGTRILPFRSGFFSLCEELPDLPVYPVSLAYTAIDGIPVGRNWLPHVAWYGDMTFAGHLWQFLGLGRMTVGLRFHAPVTSRQIGDRKMLARYCHGVVQEGWEELRHARVKKEAPANAGA
ncbi:MAG: 1-acyl-sn-glycerol-3-phosphate acyltransferase [Alphaproteobacteria bacterium]|nr:1-acyl-sn-glycerol-3-phosphate acyltransferase [Alphaproteobacteria bacterium]